MFPDTPEFDAVRDGWEDRVTAWDLGKRPVRRRVSDAAVLDTETAIVADDETTLFRALIRDYPDRAAAEEIAEEQHQLDLERAAQPPVIEVTVTTPPGGIPRAELAQVVGQAVRDFTGPRPALSGAATDPFPALRPGGRRRGKVLQATRRRSRRSRGQLPAVPVSEDDIPTQLLPDQPAVVEVRLP